MNDDDFEGLEEIDGLTLPDVDLIFDHFGAVKRAASIVGDLRKCLREEGFTREETFELVQAYWITEMGLMP